MKKQEDKQKGFSLVELAIGLLILSIAIIPIVIVTSDTSGHSSKAAKNISNEKIVANTLMEEAISNSSNFNKLINEYNVIKQKDGSKKIQTSILKDDKSNIGYRWTFKNLTYNDNKQILPDGNYLIDATLELFQPGETVSKYKLGSKILLQKPTESFKDPVIGIMFLVDMTPSMTMAKYGWGHNPISVINTNAAIAESKTFDASQIPIFNPKTDPEKVLKYIYESCNTGVKQESCIGTPQQKYSKSDDFVFGFTNDNEKTDIDERYIPSVKADLPEVNYDYKDGQSQAEEKVKQSYKNIENAVTNGNTYLIDSSISRIEMVRSSLYAFINMIEKEEAGPAKLFKIGFLPFSNTVNLNYKLNPETPDDKKGFIKLKTYIKSINRKSAPHEYIFNLIEDKDYSTDLPEALKVAHNTLIQDKTLTHRIIVLITDWNHCVEAPRELDIQSYRICLKKIIKTLQSEELVLVDIVEKRIQKDPNYKLPDDDPVKIKLTQIEETKEWFIKLINSYESTYETLYQPYHPYYSATCQEQTESKILNELVSQIYNGDINNAKGLKTNVYIFGIIDSARPPAASILGNMTAQTQEGEFLTAKDIKSIPEMFNYLILELNRLSKVEQAKRYSWNK
ncbi:MAG: prepilin-type N-terminal cleavage/methylation domain-containing protein [Vampirovibrionia bacterium]